MERKGSLLIYDDQPLWALPQDMADKLNISNAADASAHENADQVVVHGGGILPTGPMSPGIERADPLRPLPPPMTVAAAMAAASKGGPLSAVSSPSIQRSLKPQFTSSQIYEPPQWSFAYVQEETDVPAPGTHDRLNLDEFPTGAVSTAWINMTKQGRKALLFECSLQRFVIMPPFRPLRMDSYTMYRGPRGHRSR